MNASRLVPVGKIVKTHGLRGALKIVPYGETLKELGLGGKLYLFSEADGERSELTLVQSRSQGKYWVVQFTEFPDVDAAQGAVGREVFVPEECLPPTSEGEYYHYQLLGLRVETAAGKEIGVLRSIIETGSNDVYVVDDSTREILIPALAEVILEVDLQQGRMVIEPPEGLHDDL